MKFKDGDEVSILGSIYSEINGKTGIIVDSATVKNIYRWVHVTVKRKRYLLRIEEVRKLCKLEKALK